MTICSGHGFSSSKPAIRNTCASAQATCQRCGLQIGQELCEHRGNRRPTGSAGAPRCTRRADRQRRAADRLDRDQPRLLGDRLDDAVHQPAKVDELPADRSPRLTTPTRTPITAAISGQPRISATAVSAAQPRSRKRARLDIRIAQRTRSSRLAPPWFSAQTMTSARLAQAARRS